MSAALFLVHLFIQYCIFTQRCCLYTQITCILVIFCLNNYKSNIMAVVSLSCINASVSIDLTVCMYSCKHQYMPPPGSVGVTMLLAPLFWGLWAEKFKNPRRKLGPTLDTIKYQNICCNLCFSQHKIAVKAFFDF